MTDGKKLAGTMIEQKQRLSESLLWKLQRDAYSQFGIGAWSHKGVPFYLTSNPFTASEYALIVTCYLRDCLAFNAATPIDPKETINIIDLGAGTGRFAYLFLKCLLPILQHLPLQGAKVRYIMTDIVEENIAFWQKHPYFQSFIKEGILDFAHYRHDLKGQPLRLIHSKQLISKQSHKNPLILIANYFFDTIPQDLFRVNKGVLEEGRISLYAKQDSSGTIHDPKLIETLEYSYDYFPIEDPEHYYPHHPERNAVLKSYAHKYPESTFMLPLGAFETIDYFDDLSNHRLFFIAGDQGVCTDEQITHWGEPKIDRHATFSLSVSYHAIAMYLRKKGGGGYLTRYPDPFFVVMAGVLGGTTNRFPNTHCGFDHSVNRFEPKDYWNLISSVEDRWEMPPFGFILDLVKLGGWDPIVFYTFFGKIHQQLPNASQKEKDQLSFAIHHVWDQFFPINVEESDFILNLGVLFYEMKRYSDALLFFQRAVEMNNTNEKALNNMGACFLALQDPQGALECFKRAKSLNR